LKGGREARNAVVLLYKRLYKNVFRKERMRRLIPGPQVRTKHKILNNLGKNKTVLSFNQKYADPRIRIQGVKYQPKTAKKTFLLLKRKYQL